MHFYFWLQVQAKWYPWLWLTRLVSNGIPTIWFADPDSNIQGSFCVCAQPMRYWETTLHCNVVSHWLDAYTKWSLNIHCATTWERDQFVAWKRFPHFCPFARGIHRSQMDYPTNGQWFGALITYLLIIWTSYEVVGWAGLFETLWRSCNVTVMVVCVESISYAPIGVSMQTNTTCAGVEGTELLHITLMILCGVV